MSTNVFKVRGFLVLTRYHRRFIADLSEVEAPLVKQKNENSSDVCSNINLS